MSAAGDGHELVAHLVTDLLVKGAIMVVALVLVVVAGVALWRRFS